MITTTDLYQGTIQLEFNSGKHQYRVINNGRRYKVPSVTKVVGIIDKSGPLVGWAINNTLAVVRGAIGPGAEYSEAYLEAVFKAAKGQSRGVKEDAASIGKAAHTWLEHHANNSTRPEYQLVLPPEETPVRSCVDAGLQWLSEHKVEFLESERPIYSRRHRYSGTMDGLAYVDNALAVVDWKTSNGVYAEYVLQIAAYALAYSEETGRVIDKAFLIRLGKEDGVFDAHEFDARVLKRAKGAFLAALQLHRGLERMKREI